MTGTAGAAAPVEPPGPAGPPGRACAEGTTATRPVGGSGTPHRRRALSGGLWLAAGQVVPMAATLALSAVIGRTLGETALGEQSFVALVSSLLATLVIGSLTTTAVQVLSAAHGRGDAGELAWLSRVSALALSAAGVLIAAVLLAIGAQREELQVVWAIAAGTVVVDGVAAALQARVVAREGWSRVGARRLVSQIAGPLLGIAALAAGAGIPGVFAGQLVAATGLLVALVPLAAARPVAGSWAGAPHPSMASMASMAGGFLTAGLLITLLERRVEIIVLERVSVAREIAMYSVAFNLVAVAFFLSSSIAYAAMPAIASLSAAGETAKVAEALRRAARLMVTFGLLLGAAVASVGPGLVTLIYGPRFTDAAALVPWLCLVMLLAPLSSVARVYWSGVGRLRPVLACGAVGLAVDLACAVALAPRYGAGGAVAANVAGVTTGALALLVVTHRRWGSLHLGLRPWLGAVAVAAPSAAAAVAVAAAAPGAVGALGAGVAFCAVALTASRAVHPVRHDDVTWLATALPPRAGAVVRWLGAPHLAYALAASRGPGGGRGARVDDGGEPLGGGLA